MKDNTIENNHDATERNQIVLVIYNISRNSTRKHLQEIFNAYGNVKGVYIPKDDETKLLKNYAFVEYEKQQEADKASLYMGGGQIDGLIIRAEVLNLKYYSQKVKEKEKEKEKKKDKEKQRQRSRSRDKEIINNGNHNNGNHLNSKNNPSNNTKDNKLETNNRKRYHHRQSSKSSHSNSSKSKEK